MDSVSHFQMPYDDKERMAKFYKTVFGWHSQFLGPEMGEYVSVTTTESDTCGRPQRPGAINGGFFKKSLSERPQISVVVYVSDIEGALRKINASGGKTNSELHEIPGVGTFATFTDTEGNSVGMLQPSI